MKIKLILQQSKSNSFTVAITIREAYWKIIKRSANGNVLITSIENVTMDTRLYRCALHGSATYCCD